MQDDEREKRAREIAERWLARTLPGAEMRWGDMSTGMRERWLTIVDVIGEIEREQHPLFSIRVLPDGETYKAHIPEPAAAAFKAMQAEIERLRRTATPCTEKCGLCGDTVVKQAAEDTTADAPAGLSEAYLAEIAARCEAATPGPWKLGDETDIDGGHEGLYNIAYTPLDDLPERRDGAFIAHAREDVPALLAEVDRLRQIAGVKVGEIDAVLGRFKAAVGVVGPMPKRRAVYTPPVHDEALDLAAGTWTGEDDRKGTTMLNGAEPWAPKPGDRVRTAEVLTGTFGGTWAEHRRAGATGEVVHGYRDTLPAGMMRPRWKVRHDDGTEAPYDADELRPEPTVHVNTDAEIAEGRKAWGDAVEAETSKPERFDPMNPATFDSDRPPPDHGQRPDVFGLPQSTREKGGA